MRSNVKWGYSGPEHPDGFVTREGGTLPATSLTGNRFLATHNATATPVLS
jgi:hypothetical protein